ncbi:hypothetical protein LJC31_01655 [Synergistaceae bacterium OttesenSCG-928-I11]|nr:hypothetical protein [Synergistaceae bacterium OttesenSCG-928-I11]
MSVNQSDSHVYPALNGIAPIAPARRIERKGKKKGTILGNWREIFLEKLAGVDIAEVLPVEDVRAEQAKKDESYDEPPLIIQVRDGKRLTIETEEDFQNVLHMIQRLADDPEKLVESHLNLFTDPAPPGKMLNSQG